VVAAAQAERLLAPAEHDALLAEAHRRATTPGLLVAGAAEWAVEARIAQLAATVAVRRHARTDPGGAGRDLRDVRVVIGSGGVLRHAGPGEAVKIIAAMLSDHAGGWALPREPTIAIDGDYVLAAAGLLADDHPVAATGLLRFRLPAVQPLLR
jgi:hypothetical protein